MVRKNMNSERENEFEGNFEGEFTGTPTDGKPDPDPGNTNPDELTKPMTDEELAEVHERLGVEGGDK